MKILGINISHDASSCLMIDGELIYYLEDERLAKNKHYLYDPKNKNKTKFYGIERLKKYNIKELDYVVFSSYRRKYDYDDELIISDIINQILKLNIKINQISYNREEHHLYHAYNGFYNSKFNEAAVLVCDGAGAYTDKLADFRELDSIYHVNNDDFNLKYKHVSNYFWYQDKELRLNLLNNILYTNLFSCGGLFNFICTKFNLENEGHDSGKVMGMSSYGKITDDNNWVNTIDGFPYFNDSVFDILLNNEYVHFQDKANLAKKVQHETKKYTIKLIEKAIELTKTNNIVLSGGYFMNCVNNFEYVKAFPNINFYVDPICYDGGTSIGSCYFVHRKLNLPFKPIESLYLGG